LAACAAILALAAPAGAITYGTPDGNGHPEVGALLAPQPYSDGTWATCSGTLISPTVFLTAAHCDQGVSRVAVTFDPSAPFDAGAGRRPLTWSAHSWTTREELYHDKETMRMERSGQVTTSVSLRVTARDLDALDSLNGVLTAQPDLNVHGVTWHVDWDNPAWPQVRAAAIRAAIGKARDYAAALGATVHHVEHIADADLLGGDTAPHHTVRSMAFSASGGDQPGTPALIPAPQELTATIEARFRTTDVSLPGA
jgi:hypothetical protein